MIYMKLASGIHTKINSPRIEFRNLFQVYCCFALRIEKKKN